jgi:hypothetical protein
LRWVETEVFVNGRDRHLSANLDVVTTAGQRQRSDRAVILERPILVCHDRRRERIADQFGVALSMEERKLSDRVWREDVLVTDVLRVIAQSLALILPGNFLFEPVRHLKFEPPKLNTPRKLLLASN